MRKLIILLLVQVTNIFSINIDKLRINKATLINETGEDAKFVIDTKYPIGNNTKETTDEIFLRADERKEISVTGKIVSIQEGLGKEVELTHFCIPAGATEIKIKKSSNDEYKFVPDYVEFNLSMPRNFTEYTKSKKCKNINTSKEDWYFTGYTDNTIPKDYIDFVKNLYDKNNTAKINGELKSGTASKINGIPKIIHRIWIGSPQPEKYKKLEAGWKKLHPDWQYKLWTDEDVTELGEFPNKDLYDNSYNYGEKADYLRYVILEKFGGIYVDADFECFEPHDFLCNYTFFASLEPFVPWRVGNAIIGSVPHHPIMQDCLVNCRKYEHLRGKSNFTILVSSGPGILTKSVFVSADKPGNRDVIFPSSFFYPFNDFKEKSKNLKFGMVGKPETFAIHYFDTNWQKERRPPKNKHF